MTGITLGSHMAIRWHPIEAPMLQCVGSCTHVADLLPIIPVRDYDLQRLLDSS